jgi:MoaA/NifB/PqqE/SkfB family radical SAM enzyme
MGASWGFVTPQWFYPLRQSWRKQFVFRHRLTWPKLANLALCVVGFVFKSRVLGSVPVHIKVDIIPACQMRCPVCLHSAITHAERRHLPRMMSIDVFKKLVDDAAGRTMVMSLYNLGEPLLHPNLAQMARYANDKGINTYITSNFSVPLNEARISELISSGLTVLVIAVDGITRETYGLHRVGGNWDVISSNLERFVAARRQMQSRLPYLFLQYITFEHNESEVVKVQPFVNRTGMDQVIFIKGLTAKWDRGDRVRTEWMPKTARLFPRCAWPFFSTLVNSDGTVAGCCNHRMTEIHTVQGRHRSMGDVKQASIREIYGDQAYRLARALVSNPRKAGRQDAHFCSGCRVITD